MEIALLVLNYIEALIWPAAVVVGLLLFREPLTVVLQRLKGAGLPGGVSLDFSQEIRAAEILSREIAKASRKPRETSTPMLPITQANARMISLGLQPSPSGLNMSRYADLAQQDPNLALAGLRMEIELLARNLAKGFKVSIQPRDSAGLLLRRLYDSGAITSDQHQLAQKVIRLCNAALHGTSVSREEADAVIDLASVLAKDYLEWLSWGFDDGWTPPDSN